MSLKCIAVCDKCEWEAPLEHRRNPWQHSDNLPSGWARVQMGMRDGKNFSFLLCNGCVRTEQNRMLKKMGLAP